MTSAPWLHCGDHVGDQLRWVLQVGVDHRHGVAEGVLEPGGERRLVAEVAREVDDADARVGAGEAVEQLPRAVRAAVVDEHELVLEVRDRGRGALDELLHELLLVVHGRHDAQQPGST